LLVLRPLKPPAELFAQCPIERQLCGDELWAGNVDWGSDPDNGSDGFTASNLSPVSMVLVRCDPR